MKIQKLLEQKNISTFLCILKTLNSFNMFMIIFTENKRMELKMCVIL